MPEDCGGVDECVNRNRYHAAHHNKTHLEAVRELSTCDRPAAILVILTEQVNKPQLHNMQRHGLLMDEQTNKQSLKDKRTHVAHSHTESYTLGLEILLNCFESIRSRTIHKRIERTA